MSLQYYQAMLHMKQLFAFIAVQYIYIVPTNLCFLYFCSTTEPPMTEYEMQRVRNIIEKNQMFQRLGLGTLRELVGAKPVVAAREESDPLYEPGEEIEPEDSHPEQGVVDKVYICNVTL